MTKKACHWLRAPLALGAFGVLLGASRVGHGSNPWPVVPGLVVSGMGLSLLVIPLANVVLAAVPREVASGAGGVLSSHSSSPTPHSRRRTLLSSDHER